MSLQHCIAIYLISWRFPQQNISRCGTEYLSLLVLPYEMSAIHGVRICGFVNITFATMLILLQCSAILILQTQILAAVKHLSKQLLTLTNWPRLNLASLCDECDDFYSASVNNLNLNFLPEEVPRTKYSTRFPSFKHISIYNELKVIIR